MTALFLLVIGWIEYHLVQNVRQTTTTIADNNNSSSSNSRRSPRNGNVPDLFTKTTTTTTTQLIATKVASDSTKAAAFPAVHVAVSSKNQQQQQQPPPPPPPHSLNNRMKETKAERVQKQKLPPLLWKDTSVHVKKAPPRTYTPDEYTNCTLLQANDTIYQYGPWDGSPIVLERYQLVFFTIPKVGCTVFKQLFRRMMGYRDWRLDQHPLPHAPKRNGLLYLYDYPPAVAEHMLTSPEWTRALFVREPKERLLSAYLDKGTQNQYMQFHCCPAAKIKQQKQQQQEKPQQQQQELSLLLYNKLDCAHPREHAGPVVSQSRTKKDGREEANVVDDPPLLSFADFIHIVFPQCSDPHWQPQADRIDAKYWPYINFVGHMETIEHDTKRLLQHLQLWDDFGRDGWPHGSIFAGSATVSHATDSSSHLRDYFTTTALETVVDQLFEREYSLSILNLTRTRVVRMNELKEVTAAANGVSSQKKG